MGAFDAVLWDYGGVFSASPFTAAEELGRAKGIEPGQYLELIFGSYDEDTDHPWHRLERGEVGFEDACNAIVETGRSQGVESNPLELFMHMAQQGGGGGIRQAVVDCARQIKEAGFQTAVVTNNAEQFREHWTRSIPLAELFHEIVDSSVVGVRKPDPRIFELTLERLGGIDPKRTIFVDDYAGNISAAESLGIRGVLMGEDYDVALQEIASLTR